MSLEESTSLIIGSIMDKDPVLFHDQYGVPYISIVLQGQKRTFALRSGMLEYFIRYEFFEEDETTFTIGVLKAAIETLAAKAVVAGPCIELHNRIARASDAIYFDLGSGKVVRINKQGWKIMENAPMPFCAYRHQKQQVEPKKKGEIAEILQVTNIHSHKDQLLFLVSLIACLIPDIPRPIVYFYGRNGSAKSFHEVLMRRLIDPSETEKMSFPPDRKELVQQLAHNYLATYDNISHISQDQSDSLCRAITGEGTSKRLLYTDQDDIIFRYRRAVVISSIKYLARNADLRERCIAIRLQRISEKDRRDEESLLQEFEEMRPRIFGAMLTTLSGAMKRIENLDIGSLPRMADFARWGCAIAEELGYTSDEFLGVYRSNLKTQHKEMMRQDEVSLVVMEYIRERGEIRGEPSDVYAQLCSKAKQMGMDTDKGSGWPQASQVLTRRLNLLEDDLADAGIRIKTLKKRGNDRWMVIEKLPRANDQS